MVKAFAFLSCIGSAVAAATECSADVTPGQDCSGQDISFVTAYNTSDCCAACAAEPSCGAFVFVGDGVFGNRCYLKYACSPAGGCDRCTAGTLIAPAPSPPTPAPKPLAPLSWEEAKSLAASKLAEMTREEKNLMIKAYGPSRGLAYVGNIPGVPRVGIPSLNMQDAGQGFRVDQKDLVGTATSWPSGLAMGATWNAELVREVGVALGEEFRGKGANVILGPGLEVMRVARDGRAFEYISGEDPVLGAKLGAKYVEGVHSQGVMAVLKHFALHHQQENNKQQSSNADARTTMELYYPPFEAGVQAGAVSVMSAYNKVNETWAAENDQLLRRDLKDRLGFEGFVMSDWGGFNGEESAWHNGCDMDMWASFTQIGQHANPALVSEADIDNSVSRILAAMYKVNLLNSSTCTPPGCDSRMRADVRGDHEQLSLAAAIESIVLLKNEGDVLPLRSDRVKRIAVVGGAADAPGIITIDYPGYPFPGDYYAGGGSGHVQTHRTVTPLTGIKAAAQAAGIEVVSSPSNDVGAALAIIGDADVTIISLGTSSTEDVDRSSLSLDDGADDFVAAVAAQAKATVVLAQSPGPFLTPWRSEVDGIAALFLGGQETGHAWGSVLFGQESPSGRLPVTLPARNVDQIPPTSQLTIDYAEGLATGYRGQMEVAFPFGHGLSYSRFQLDDAKLTDCDAPAGGDVCITVALANVGAVPARAVPQLYLEFPDEAKEPAPLLKAFEKTELLAPGESLRVAFRLTSRDMSHWSPVSGWTQAPMSGLTARIGFSAADIVASLPLSGLLV
eukprot:TRINITY_DN44141_c0_g1_i1.p1 TRINITY_DN44141_c0_g1~~TRINITY_DN44141_c0_g1_i1.p1  ORF type:complete len:812 (-),score=142.10 TRINITY_DN44141_c0_g1_i1:294-2660(-)